MRERVYLTGSIRLTADPENRNPARPDIFTIRQVVGEGGSTICYEAVKNGLVSGKLKEFYPVDAVGSRHSRFFNLIREEDGQLLPGAGSVRSFASCCEQYIEKYRILERKIKDNPQNEILKNYIQLGDVFYGCEPVKDHEEEPAEPKTGEQRDGETESVGEEPAELRMEAAKPTVYLWCRGLAGIGMDQYFSDLKRSETMDAAEKMRNILEAVTAVVDCVRALHTAGLMHLDVKPANFFVECNSEGEIEPDKLTLFDINSICERPSEAVCVLGTPGFSAPEVRNGRGEYRSDFYSIGALLFHAVMDTEEKRDWYYRDSDYRSLETLLGSSKLISESEINADLGFRSILSNILRRCLNRNPDLRYESCGDLKKDLTEARKRWARVELNHRKSVRSEIAEPAAVIQKLLYDYPLYSAFESEPRKAGQRRSAGGVAAEKGASSEDRLRNLNILVIGQDPYGRKFMDTCLEVGQMYGVRLAITAASQNPSEEKERYLKDRPAFTQFVQVDDDLPFYGENNYGIVRFTGTSDLQAASELRKYHYIFIAMDEDAIGLCVAREITGKLKSCGHRCTVCYLQREADGSALPGKLPHGKPVPVYVNRPVNFRSIDQNIGEMAFHTHVIWSNRVNTDLTRERKKFFESEEKTDRYNRISSLYYAVSIKYKLHSIGIWEDDPDRAAAQFAEQVLAKKDCDEGARRKFNRMVALEHRRWVMEKVMDGWTAPPRDLNSGEMMLKDAITRASVKDMERKMHPCLVPGTEETPLESPEFTREKWDRGDISGLDELDRMSVELHRCFLREANLIRQENFLEGGNLFDIRSILPPNEPALMQAFAEFRETLKGILKGSEKSSRQYDASESALLEACGQLPESSRRIVKQRLAALRHDMFPVIESNLYRNYKKYDEDLIEKIPFILTWRSNPSLAMWLEDGSGGDIFSNVAAASALIPGNVTYLYFCRNGEQARRSFRLLLRISDYYFARNLTCGIHLAVAFHESVTEENRAWFRDSLRKLQEATTARGKAGRFEGIDAEFDVDSAAEAWACFAEYLKENREYIDLFDAGNLRGMVPAPECGENGACLEEYFGTGISTGDPVLTALREIGLPYFQYAWESGNFAVCEGCEYLRYLKSNVCLRVGDLCALLGGAETKTDLPEFAEDYERLWEIFCGDGGDEDFETAAAAWNQMVRALQAYDRSHRTVARLYPDAPKSGDSITAEYVLPEYCFATARKLLGSLAHYGIIGEDSNLSVHTSDTCRLRLTFAAEYREALDEVFSIPQRLLLYYNMDVVKRVSCGGNVVAAGLEDQNAGAGHRKSGEAGENIGKECLKYEEMEKKGCPWDGDTGKDYLEICCENLTVQGLKIAGTSFAGTVEILRKLEKSSFLRKLTADESRREVNFTYLAPRIKWLLTTEGAMLKVYAYYEALKTGYFDTVSFGSCMEWEDDSEPEEKVSQDFVLTKGFRSLWIRSGEESTDPGQEFTKTFGRNATVVLLKETASPFISPATANGENRPALRMIAGKKQLDRIGEELAELIKY